MREVIALVGSREAESRLRAALRGRAVVVPVARCRELLEAVARPDASAAVVELRDADGVATAPTIRRVREGYPLLPVVAYSPYHQPAAADLLAVAQAGVNGLLLRDIDDVGVFPLREALTHAADQSIARHVIASLGSTLRPRALSIVEFCLAEARHALTVEDLTRSLGMHRKTLRTRLAESGFPSPQATIAWCRLLLAARLLEDPDRPLEHIAVQMGYSSGAALRNMLRRYTGLCPAQVRGRPRSPGDVAAATSAPPCGLALVLARFRCALASGAAEGSGGGEGELGSPALRAAG